VRLDAQFPNNPGHKNHEQVHLLLFMENDMSETNNAPTPGFLDRLMANDATKKGLATAVAGVLIAAVTEIVWPSN
jgi:hypothetical protein